MNFISVVFIALGLSMDALAVSIATGASLRKDRFVEAFKMAGSFGFFQALMPVIGASVGVLFRDMISEWDHWIAFIILCTIGVKMIYEAYFIEEEEKKKEGGKLPLTTLFILAIATSLDALATGFSISLIGSKILGVATIIGIVTFFVCFIGIFVGERVGHILEKKIEIFGGIILILVGLKILLSHLNEN